MKSIEHLLVLTPGFPRDEADFLCIPPLQAFLEDLQQFQPQLRITVLALHYPYHEEPYTWKGIRVYPLGGNNQRGPQRWLLWQRAKSVFRRIHQGHPVQAIHSLWLQECAWLGALLARKYGADHVATLQGQDALPDNRYLKKLPFDHLKVMAISARGLEMLQASAPVPHGRVIPWGLRPTEKNWTPPDSDRPVDLLAVGGLVPVKRYDRFIRVVAALRDDFPEIKAEIIGEGPEEFPLREMVKALGLEQHIRFRGLLPRSEVLSRMAQSKIFLHPSQYEGQGYVFAEALARGMHLVSGPVGMAEPGDKWTIASHTIGMVEACRTWLNGPVDFQARPVADIRQTVQACWEWYGQ